MHRTTPATPRQREVIAGALALLEEHGPDGLTMRALAERLGIQAPSLYKHFPGKDAVEVALIAEGLRDWGSTFAGAVRDNRDPLRDVAAAYRHWALRRPHLYRLMTAKPMPRERLSPDLEAQAAAPLLAAVGGNPDLARAAWALAHGLASLEIAGRFPQDADLDAAWTAGIAALHCQVDQQTDPYQETQP